MKNKKKIFNALIILSIMLIFMVLSLSASAAEFNLEEAKMLYEAQIQKEKQENEQFADAYMVDIYNNDKPVLIVVSSDYPIVKGVCYEIKNHSLVKNNDIELMYTHGSGWTKNITFLKDNNNKTYYFKILSEKAYSDDPNGGYFDIEIGYYSGVEYKKMYTYHIKTMDCGEYTTYDYKEVRYDDNQIEYPCSIYEENTILKDFISINFGLYEIEYLDLEKYYYDWLDENFVKYGAEYSP